MIGKCRYGSIALRERGIPRAKPGQLSARLGSLSMRSLAIQMGSIGM